MTTKLSCTFTGTGTTAATGTNLTSLSQGPFTLMVSGVGTAVLQASADGANWFAVSTDPLGTPNGYAVTASTPAVVVGENVAAEMQYRINITAYTSTVTVRILQGGQVDP